MDSLIETLAERCHSNWGIAAKEVFLRGKYNEDGSFVISAQEDAELSSMLLLSFDKLSENDKDRFRRQAHRVVEDIIRVALHDIGATKMPATVAQVLDEWSDERIDAKINMPLVPQKIRNVFAALRGDYVKNLSLTWHHVTDILAQYVASLKSNHELAQELRRRDESRRKKSDATVTFNMTAEMSDDDIERVAKLAWERVEKGFADGAQSHD